MLVTFTRRASVRSLNVLKVSIEKAQNMKKLIGWLLVAALTFILGVLISPIRFWQIAIGCGKGSTVTFTSSYFVTLRSNVMGYDSVAEADAAFQDRLNKSVRVINQGEKFNNEGRKIGPRALIVFNGEDNKQYFGVLWAEEKFLRCLYSTSLIHVLAFEEQRF